MKKIAIALMFVILTSCTATVPAPKNDTAEAIQELANGFEPDWSDPHEIKYYIAYDHFNGYPVIGISNTKEIYGVPYFKTASQAGEAMLYLGRRLK